MSAPQILSEALKSDQNKEGAAQVLQHVQQKALQYLCSLSTDFCCWEYISEQAAKLKMQQKKDWHILSKLAHISSFECHFNGSEYVLSFRIHIDKKSLLRLLPKDTESCQPGLLGCTKEGAHTKIAMMVFNLTKHDYK